MKSQIELEDLDYQRRAISAVVGVLDGQVKNTFDNSNPPVKEYHADFKTKVPQP